MLAGKQAIHPVKLILTCEHGGNNIPIEYSHLFKHHKHILDTHKGFDIGSLDLYNHLKPLADFSLSSETSRLLIELNRSLHHNDLFSKFSKTLTKSEKDKLILGVYLAYRKKVEQKIREFIEINDTVSHISVHSFTPILNNIEHQCDIGLLYDPGRTLEKQFCKMFKTELSNQNPEYIIRYNYPYLGKSDGFTTYLRKKFSENYIGVELEINQKFSIKNMTDSTLKQVLYTAIKPLINQ